MYYDRDRGRIIEVLNPYTMETYKAIYMMGLLGTSKVVIVAVDTHDGHIEYPELRLSSISDDEKHGFTYYANPFEGLDIVWNRTIMTYCHEFISQEEYNYVMMHVIRCIEGDNYIYDKGSNSFKNSELCHTRYGTPAPAGAPEDKTNPYDDDIYDRLNKEFPNPSQEVQNPYPKWNPCKHISEFTGIPTIEFSHDGTIICTRCSRKVTETEIYNNICAFIPNDTMRNDMMIEVIKKKDIATGPRIDPAVCTHTYPKDYTALVPDGDSNMMRCLRCGKMFPNEEAAKKDKDMTIEGWSDGDEPAENKPKRKHVKNTSKKDKNGKITDTRTKQQKQSDSSREYYEKRRIDIDRIASIVSERLENFTPKLDGNSVADVVREYMKEFPEYVYEGKYFMLPRLYNLKRGHTQRATYYSPAEYVVNTRGTLCKDCLTPEDYELIHTFSTHDILNHDFDGRHLGASTITFIKSAISWMLHGLKRSRYQKPTSLGQFALDEVDLYQNKYGRDPTVGEMVSDAKEKFPSVNPDSVRRAYYRYVTGTCTGAKQKYEISAPKRIQRYLDAKLFSELAYEDDRGEIMRVITEIDGKYDKVIDGTISIRKMTTNTVAAFFTTFVILKSAYSSIPSKIILHPAMDQLVDDVIENYPTPYDMVDRMYKVDHMSTDDRSRITCRHWNSGSALYVAYQCMLVMHFIRDPQHVGQFKQFAMEKEYDRFAALFNSIKGLNSPLIFARKMMAPATVLFCCLEIDQTVADQIIDIGAQKYPIYHGPNFLLHRNVRTKISPEELLKSGD